MMPSLPSLKFTPTCNHRLHAYLGFPIYRPACRIGDTVSEMVLTICNYNQGTADHRLTSRNHTPDTRSGVHFEVDAIAMLL